MAASGLWLKFTSMSTTKMFALLVLAVLLPKVNANGQQKFQFTFHGTSWTTNETGRFISKPANNKTLLQEYALLTHGTNNLKNLTLAYHYRGDEHGDVVEVVNAKDGTTIYPLFGLFFSDEYGRMSLLAVPVIRSNPSITYIRIKWIIRPEVPSPLNGWSLISPAKPKPSRSRVNFITTSFPIIPIAICKF